MRWKKERKLCEDVLRVVDIFCLPINEYKFETQRFQLSSIENYFIFQSSPGNLRSIEKLMRVPMLLAERSSNHVLTLPKSDELGECRSQIDLVCIAISSYVGKS